MSHLSREATRRGGHRSRPLLLLILDTARRPIWSAGSSRSIASQMWLDAAWRGSRQVVFVTGEPGIGQDRHRGCLPRARGRGSARVDRAGPMCRDVRDERTVSPGARRPCSAVSRGAEAICSSRSAAAGAHLARADAVAPRRGRPGRAAARAPGGDARADAARDGGVRRGADGRGAARPRPRGSALERRGDARPALADREPARARAASPDRHLPARRWIDASSPHQGGCELRGSGARPGACPWRCSSEAAVADYLRERFPESSLPSELARVIHQRTEGNPLFMVSVVDDLVARGLVAARDRGWELCVALEDVEVSVPESLRQMIERQIGRLAREEQRTLEAGSVGGMQFSAASVAAALDCRAAEVEKRCGELARRRLFIRSLGSREWPDRTVTTRYEFLHSLYRNTLYQRIAPARRRELHQSIGERQEGGHGDRAGDDRHGAGRPLRASRGRRARGALPGASRGDGECGGRPTARRSAISRGLWTFPAGYPIPSALIARLALLEQLGLARRSMGDVPAAVEDFAALAAQAHDQGRTAEEVRALLHLGSALSWIDREQSLAAVERALALTQGSPTRFRERTSAATAAFSASCREGGGTRMPRLVAGRSTSPGGPETGRS